MEYSSIISLTIGLIGTLLFGVYWFQNKLIYFPQFPQGSNVRLDFFPPQFGMPNYEDIYVSTSDNVKIHFWLIKHLNQPQLQSQSQSQSQSQLIPQEESLSSTTLRKRNKNKKPTHDDSSRQQQREDEMDSEEEAEAKVEEEEGNDKRKTNFEYLPTILFFHGNAGNIGHRLPQAMILYKNVPANIALVSYRGYGLSQGEPSEEGLKKDAQAVLDYLWKRPDLDKSQFISFGSSIGGGVAISLAHANQDKIQAVIIENTFTHLEDMMSVIYPFLSPFKFLLKNKWPNRELVPDLKMGLLLLSGREDELVPCSMMDQLFQLAKKATPKKMVNFINGTHNDTWMQDSSMYGKQVSEFVKSLKNPKS